MWRCRECSGGTHTRKARNDRKGGTNCFLLALLSHSNIRAGWLRQSCWLTSTFVLADSPHLVGHGEKLGALPGWLFDASKDLLQTSTLHGGPQRKAPKHKSRTSMLPSSWSTKFSKDQEQSRTFGTLALKHLLFKVRRFSHFRISLQEPLQTWTILANIYIYTYVIWGPPPSNTVTATTRIITFLVGDPCSPSLDSAKCPVLGGGASKYIISIVFAIYPHTPALKYVCMMNQNMSKHSIQVFYCAPELSC